MKMVLQKLPALEVKFVAVLCGIRFSYWHLVKKKSTRCQKYSTDPIQQTSFAFILYSLSWNRRKCFKHNIMDIQFNKCYIKNKNIMRLDKIHIAFCNSFQRMFLKNMWKRIYFLKYKEYRMTILRKRTRMFKNYNNILQCTCSTYLSFYDKN